MVHRLFFALLPNNSLRRQLHHVTKKIDIRSGRWVRIDNLHLTLLFLGNITSKQLPCIDNAASKIHIKPFSFTIDQLGHFKKSKVLWLGDSRQSCAPLMSLATQLKENVSTCDIALEKIKFQAHVTLARKVNSFHGQGIVDQITWPVNDFCLMESIPVERGVVYQVVQRYPLTASQ